MAHSYRGVDVPVPPRRACVLTYPIRRGLTRYIRRFDGGFVPVDWAEVAWYWEDGQGAGSVSWRGKSPALGVNFCLVRGKDGRVFSVRFVVDGRGVRVKCVHSLFPVF